MSRVSRRLALLFIPLLLVACNQARELVPTVAQVAATPMPPGSPTPASVTTLARPQKPTASATVAPPTPVTSPPVEASPSITATSSPGVALPRYVISVTLAYDEHYLVAQETVHLANSSNDAWTELFFNASANYWTGLFSLEDTMITLDGVMLPIMPQFENTMLRFSLPRPLKPGETIVVAIRFNLKLPPLDPLGWGPEGNAGWGPDVTQVGDWYPALVPYRDGQGWQVWDYYPVGDPVRSGLADYVVTVRTDPDVQVAAAGWSGTDGIGRHYQLAGARAFAFLASRDYILLEGQAGTVPVQVYVLSAHEEGGIAALETIKEVIPFLGPLYAPYPYDEFVLAENGFLTAMEYSALVSQSGYAFETYQGSADALLVPITAHEVAHQWWYGAVGNDQVEAPWLDEAMAMLSELLFYERFYPDLVSWWWSYRVDRWEPQGVVDVTIYEFVDSRSFVHNMYGIAARFIRDLRASMGEEAFFAFLADYYQRQQTIGWTTRDEFFAAVLRHSDAESLRTLVQGYFRDLPTPFVP